MTTIPQLQIIANIDGDELFYVIDDPTGAPLNRRATVDQVVARVFALPGFAETVDDRVAQLLQASSGTIQLTYDDAGNLLSIGVGSITPEQVTGLDERIRDTVGAALVQGPGVTITVDDTANTITISATGAPPVQAPTATATGTASTQGVPAVFVVSMTNTDEVWAVLSRAGAEEGARVRVLAPSGNATLTPAQTGSYTLRVYSAQTGGTQLFESAAFTVGAPAATGTITGSATTDGVAAPFVATFAGIAQAFAALARDGIEQGPRVAVGTSGATVSLTPAGVGSYTARLFTTLTGGSLLAETPPFVVGTGQAGVAPLMDIPWQGTGAPADTVTYSGLVFARGDLLPSDTYVLKAGATAYRTQISPTALHPDGSVRTAILAMEAPALADIITGGNLTTTLVRGEAHPTPGADLTLTAAALSGRAASMVVTTTADANPFTINLIAELDAAPYFVRGPLLAQKRIIRDVPAASCGGVTSLRVIVDFTLTKDGSIYVEFAMSNDSIRNMAPGDVDSGSGGTGTSGSASYKVAVTVDGTSVANYTCATHQLYARFTRTVWPGTLRGVRAGGALAPLFPLMLAPGRYLAERAKVISSFDWQAGSDPVVVTFGGGDGYNVILSSPSWDAPFDRRFCTPNPGGAGISKRDGIGPNTDSQSDFMLGGFRAAARVMVGNAEAASSFPSKYWYRVGGPLGQGAWANARQPVMRDLWLHPQDSRFFPGISSAPWLVNFSHMPSHFFIAYLLTGRRLFRDEIVCQGIYQFHCFACNEGDRFRGLPNTWNPATGQGMIVMRADQYRTIGWRLRDCLQAWFVDPTSSDTWTDFWSDIVRGNFAWLNSQVPRWNGERGELAGILYDIIDPGQNTASMNYGYNSEFIVSAFINAVWWEAPGALQFLRDYHMRWLLGRFLNQPTFNPAQLALMQLDMPFGAPTTWAQLQAIQGNQLTQPPVTWLGFASPGWDNVPSATRNLADLCNIFPGDTRVWRAYRWFWKALSEAPDFTVPPLEINAGRSALHREVLRTNTKHLVVPFGWTVNFVPPEVVPNQTVSVPEDSAVNVPVAQIMTRGGMPWSFAIAGGDGAALFAIDEFGAVRPISALNFDTAPEISGGGRGYSLQITATNKWGTSAPATVTVRVTDVTIIAPTLVPAGPFLLITDRPVTHVVATLVNTGSPATLSIVAGNTGGLFTIVGNELRVAASLAGTNGQVRDLVVRAVNASGQDEETYRVNLSDPIPLPNISASGGTVNGTEGAAVGSLTRAITNTGGPAQSIAITSGNGANQFELVDVTALGATLRNSAVLPSGNFPVVVTATNPTGSSAATVTFAVGGAPYVHGVATTHFAALGLRRLRDNYTGPLVRGRRASDGAEQDIGFVAGTGLLDTTALTTFANGALVELVTWYDQSALAQHFNAAANRPRLTNGSGAIVTIGANNRPAVDFSQNDNQGLFNPNVVMAGGQSLTMCGIASGTFDNFQLYEMLLAGIYAGEADAEALVRLTRNFFVNVGYQLGGQTLTSSRFLNTSVAYAFGGAYVGAGGGNQVVSIDGTADSGGGSGWTQTVPASGFVRIGGVPAGSPAGVRWWRGQISEVLIMAGMTPANLHTITADQKAWLG